MRRQRGVAAPLLVVLTALVVVAMSGISTDLWRILHARRTLVGAVDAAATAATAALDEVAYRASHGTVVRLDPVLAVDHACDVLATSLGVESCPGENADIAVAGDAVTVTARRTVELAIVGRLGFTAGGSVIELAASAEAVLVRGDGG